MPEIELNTPPYFFALLFLTKSQKYKTVRLDPVGFDSRTPDFSYLENANNYAYYFYEPESHIIVALRCSTIPHDSNVPGYETYTPIPVPNTPPDISYRMELSLTSLMGLNLVRDFLLKYHLAYLTSGYCVGLTDEESLLCKMVFDGIFPPPELIKSLIYSSSGNRTIIPKQFD